jgi:hypothetical protein
LGLVRELYLGFWEDLAGRGVEIFDPGKFASKSPQFPDNPSPNTKKNEDKERIFFPLFAVIFHLIQSIIAVGKLIKYFPLKNILTLFYDDEFFSV